MICKNCGIKIDDDSNFCPVCGSSVISEPKNIEAGSGSPNTRRPSSTTNKTYSPPEISVAEKHQNNTKKRVAFLLVLLAVICVYFALSNKSGSSDDESGRGGSGSYTQNTTTSTSTTEHHTSAATTEKTEVTTTEATTTEVTTTEVTTTEATTTEATTTQVTTTETTTNEVQTTEEVTTEALPPMDELDVFATIDYDKFSYADRRNLLRDAVKDVVPICVKQYDNGRIDLSIEFIVEVKNMTDDPERRKMIGGEYDSMYAADVHNANKHLRRFFSRVMVVKEVYDYGDKGYFRKLSIEVNDFGILACYLRYGNKIKGCDWDKWYNEYLPSPTYGSIYSWKPDTKSPFYEQDYSKVVERVNEAYDEVIKDGMSDYEKELALYDWLMRNGSYAYDENGDPADKHSSYDILVNGEGVCEAYALAYMFLCWRANIYCEAVSGDVKTDSGEYDGGHAWNIVYLDGDYYMVDPTWDDSLGEVHEYFNLSGDEMKVKGIRIWQEEFYPECNGTKY